MLKLTAPQGTKTITLQKDENLDLYLEDFEEGSRNFELSIILLGEGANVRVHGVIRTTNTDEKFWKVTLDLQGKNQMGTLELKGIADDASLLKFDGAGIIGAPSEEGEVTIEEKIILFSDKARGHALPILRVETEKVRAAKHAASIAPFDEEMFFYLESRGIIKDEAKKLLLNGFLGRENTAE
jgi:Fe-S cluster assembly protein SufD